MCKEWDYCFGTKKSRNYFPDNKFTGETIELNDEMKSIHSPKSIILQGT